MAYRSHVQYWCFSADECRGAYPCLGHVGTLKRWAKRWRRIGLDSEARVAWAKRLDVVGRAQARYLWLLLVAGLFYLALHVRVTNGSSADAGELLVPLVDLELSALPVWASGPAVLSILLLAANGSLRAFKTAASALNVERYGVGEEYDSAPNALDFVVYTTSASPRSARALLLFTYPLYLALFVAEAWWMLAELGSAEGVPFRPVFLGLGVIGALFATWRVLEYLGKSAKRAYHVAKGMDHV